MDRHPMAITRLLAPKRSRMAIAGDVWPLPTLMASNQPAAMAIIRPARQHLCLMLEGAGDRLAGRRAPHPRGLVPARGDHACAVGAERGAYHLCLMHEGAGDRLAGRRVPHPRGLVIARGDYARAVGAEHGAYHLRPMFKRWDEWHVPLGLPKHHAEQRAVVAALASFQEIRNRFLIAPIDEDTPSSFRVRLGDEFAISALAGLCPEPLLPSLGRLVACSQCRGSDDDYN